MMSRDWNPIGNPQRKITFSPSGLLSRIGEHWRSDDQPVAQRQGDGFRAASHVQLRQNVTDVGPYGGRADAQLRRDLRIVQFLDDQGQHGTFSLRQVETRRWSLGDGVNQQLDGLGCNSGAAGVRVRRCKYSTDCCDLSGSRLHRRGRTSAIRAAEESDWLTAS